MKVEPGNSWVYYYINILYYHCINMHHIIITFFFKSFILPMFSCEMESVNWVVEFLVPLVANTY